MHMVQDHFRYVSLEAVKEIAELLELRPAEVHDTMSFYGFFRDEQNPLGKHRVWVCRSLSCASVAAKSCWRTCASVTM